MACVLGVEQSCTECRMCGNGESRIRNQNAEYEWASVQQSNQGEGQTWDIPGQISVEEYLQSLK